MGFCWTQSLFKLNICWYLILFVRRGRNINGDNRFWILDSLVMVIYVRRKKHKVRIKEFWIKVWDWTSSFSFEKSSHSLDKELEKMDKLRYFLELSMIWHGVWYEKIKLESCPRKGKRRLEEFIGIDNKIEKWNILWKDHCYGAWKGKDTFFGTQRLFKLEIGCYFIVYVRRKEDTLG